MSIYEILVHKLVKVCPTLGYIDLVVTFSYSGPCLINNHILSYTKYEMAEKMNKGKEK